MISTNSSSVAATLPPLPQYTLTPIPDLIPGISDAYIFPILPVAIYWILSMIFHIIDVYDIWPQYRLHTPEEITKRNHVSRYEVARDVVIQQIIQVGMSLVLDATEERQMTGKEEYDVAVWATRIRLAQRALPPVLGFLGLNAAAISKNMAASHPLLAGALAGGHYPFLTATSLSGSSSVPIFAHWEMWLAKTIYWIVVPGLQLFAASVILDTWQYFLHRLMHVNMWLYSKCTYEPSALALRLSALTEYDSYLPLPSPSALRAVRVRCPVQPSR